MPRGKWDRKLKTQCARCGSNLNGVGKCTDETCPFFDHLQRCPAGWRGHPEHASGECTCIVVYQTELKVTLHVHTSADRVATKNLVGLGVINALRSAEHEGFDIGLGEDAAISVEDVEVTSIDEL